MSNAQQMSQLFNFKYDLELTRLKQEGTDGIYRKDNNGLKSTEWKNSQNKITKHE